MVVADFLMALAFAAPVGAPTPDANSVLAQERALWAAWKRHDLPAIESVTAPDYACVSEEGPSAAIGIGEIRKQFDSYRLREYRLGPMQARVLSPDAIVIVYNAHLFGSVSGKELSRGVAEASVWVRRNGRWLNVLLHEVTRPGKEKGIDD